MSLRYGLPPGCDSQHNEAGVVVCGVVGYCEGVEWEGIMNFWGGMRRYCERDKDVWYGAV